MQVSAPTNAVASPLRYEIDPRDLIRIHDGDRGAGRRWAPSTTRTRRAAAYPSQTDVNLAQNWPGVVWLIVSLADPDAPDLRGFHITGRRSKKLR